MDPRLLEPYLIPIAAVQAALPRETCEALLKMGRAAGSHRERLQKHGRMTTEQITALARKHAEALERRIDIGFALEVQHLGFAKREAVDECVKALQEFTRKGFAFRIDELMVKRGVLDSDQAVQVQMAVEREVILCPVCLAFHREPKKVEIPEFQCLRCKVRFRPDTLTAASTTQIHPPSRSGVDAAGGEGVGLPERIGDYQILSELGRGGMGVVYEAEQISLKRKVALKVAPASLSLNPEVVERFHREAKALAKVRHPNIVQIYGSGEHGPYHFYAMEFIVGKDADDMLRETRSDLRLAADLARQIAEALQAAHEAGVIHRDIKPGNIIVDEKKQAHLMDFGLARASDDVKLTREGYAVGTPAYMPPEQAEGRVSAMGPLFDVYSLGATLYAITTGHAPYLGQTAEAILKQVISRDPISPVKWNKAIPRDLETIIQHSMERDPAKRYPSAGAMAADLKRFLAGEPIEARPISTLERGLRFVRRNKVLLGVSASAGLVGLIIAGGVMVSTHKKRQEAARLALQAEETERQAHVATQKATEETKKAAEEAAAEKRKADQERREKEEAQARTERERKQREEDARRAEEDKKRATAEAHEREMLSKISKEVSAIQVRRAEAAGLYSQVNVASTKSRDARTQVEQYRQVIAIYDEIGTWLDRVTDPEVKSRLAADDSFKAAVNVSAERTSAHLSLYDARVRQAWHLFHRENKPEEGFKEIDDLLKENPDSARAGCMKGKMLYRSKRIPEAEQQYKAVLEKSPNSDEANLGLALICVDRADLKGARPYLDAAEASSPGTTELRVLRGRCLFAQREYEKAIEILKPLQQGTMWSSEGVLLRSQCYLAAKRPKEAVESMERLIRQLKKDPPPDPPVFSEFSEEERKEYRYQAWLVNGQALLESGRKDDARDALERALKEKPGDSAAKQLLAQAQKP